MSLCASCGRTLPCGCPDPRRGAGPLSALFGVVCDRCDAYNEAERELCVQCDHSLRGAPEKPAAAPLQLTTKVIEPRQARSVSKTLIELNPLGAGPPLELVETGAPSPVAKVDSGRSPTLPAAGPPPLQLGSSPAPLQLSKPAPLQLGQSPAPLPLVRPVAPAQHCPRCGTSNPADYRFCGSCGGSLAVAAPPAIQGREPLSPGRAAARVLRGERLGQTLPLGLQSTLGRGDCEVSFPRDPYLSTSHCTLLFQLGRLHVHDEGGSSGTFVRIREEEAIEPGQYFSIGDHLLRFLGPLPGAAPAADGSQIFGGPRPPPDAVRIEEIHEGGVPGRLTVRRGPSIVFGRDESCDISFPGDRFVSSRHCSIGVGMGGKARLGDLGSTNGTFVRLPPGGERELFRGDCLRLGGEVLQLVEG